MRGINVEVLLTLTKKHVSPSTRPVSFTSPALTEISFSVSPTLDLKREPLFVASTRKNRQPATGQLDNFHYLLGGNFVGLRHLLDTDQVGTGYSFTV